MNKNVISTDSVKQQVETKQVVMEAVFIAKFEDGVIPEEEFYFDVGGFVFDIPINGIITGVPFDFNAAGHNKKVVEFEGKPALEITYFSGRGPFYNEYDIADDIWEYPDEIGMPFEAVTSEFLAGVVLIEEFFVGAESYSLPDFRVQLQSICFTDENGQEFSVAQEVLDAYNASPDAGY